MGHPGIRRHRGGQLPGAGQGAGQDHGGENGCVLSGGKRQRISIARAFLKDAPIILLDEATASLDVENETAIQEALSRLIKQKTVLIIAHRMRTVAGADQVVVLFKSSYPLLQLKGNSRVKQKRQLSKAVFLVVQECNPNPNHFPRMRLLSLLQR